MGEYIFDEKMWQVSIIGNYNLRRPEIKVLLFNM
jgi:hypothetical protein